MTGCQKEIDKNLEESQEQAGQSSGCCSNSVKLRDGGLLRRQGNTCPINHDYRNNPPPNGADHHGVFTCDYGKWPNVCANARSAILKRGKTQLLTYVAGGDGLHANRPWYHQKFRSSTYGWTLNGCQVEEYPFANGDPLRNPNDRKWNEQRVLRLIPADENENHGQALASFIREAGNNNYANADGFIYSMEFENHPTGTTDDDFYLGRDTSKNICAQPYGNAFLLVNQANVDKGERSYDPWWDDKLIAKATKYYTNKQGTATSSDIGAIPSMYCQYPSPGAKDYINGH